MRVIITITSSHNILFSNNTNMNLHPIIIHFPIACLVLYTILEVVSFFIPKTRQKLHITTLFLLYIGLIGTFFALQSGELAQDILDISKSWLVDTHEDYGEFTHQLYMILWIFYIAYTILQNKIGKNYRPKIVKQYQQKLIDISDHKGIKISIVIIACIGLITLSITWALGWAISHGPDTDFIVSFFYNLLIQ